MNNIGFFVEKQFEDGFWSNLDPIKFWELSA